MKRVRVWAPRLSTRMPVRAKRAVGQDESFDPAPGVVVSRWLIVGSAVLGVLVACQLVVGIVVVSQ